MNVPAIDFDDPSVPQLACVCFSDPNDCICSPQEIWARRLAYGHPDTPALDPQTREKWVSEIARYEGQPPAEEFRDHSDADLALDLLGAWTDYCRDKGLLP